MTRNGPSLGRTAAEGSRPCRVLRAVPGLEHICTRTGQDVLIPTDDLTTAMQRFDDAVMQRHRQTAEQVLDDDYALALVHPSPAQMPRARWLEVLEDYHVHSYSVVEQRVDESDGLAVVLSKVQMRATVLGDDRSGTFVISDVWRLRDGRWRVWRRHSPP